MKPRKLRLKYLEDWLSEEPDIAWYLNAITLGIDSDN